MKICRDVMTAEPLCCLPHETVDRAAQLMKWENVGSIPVIENLQRSKLIGILTDRDIALQVVATGRDPAKTKILEIMKRDPFTCRGSDDVQKALDVMAKHQVRRIPVVDKYNQIIGIIAQGDVALRLDEPKTTGEVVAKISK